MPEIKYLRVTDKDTGHRRTIRESQLPHGNFNVLKQDAVDLNGVPLPPEYATPESLSSKSTDGQKAETKKESS